MHDHDLGSYYIEVLQFMTSSAAAALAAAFSVYTWLS
jgi:hypothetical protein